MLESESHKVSLELKVHVFCYTDWSTDPFQTPPFWKH